MNEHDHPHPHDEQEPVKPAAPLDPGSQALAEALRSSFAIVRIVMFALVVVFLCSGFFSVGPQQQGILLRLGRPVGEGQEALLKPGWHWSFPYPIDEHTNVSVLGIQQAKSSIGWYFTTPAQEAAGTEPMAGPSLNPATDSYVLTADGNIIHTRATVLYRIQDPIQYTFGFANAAGMVQNALNNALVQVAATFRADDILTRNVAGFRDAVRARVTELVDRQKLGVTVEDCVVERSIPPRQLTEAFNRVLNSQVARDKLLNEARSEENQITNKASADAQSIVNLAQSDRARLVAEIASEAANFNQLLPQFRSNPTLLVQQRLSEKIASIMGSTNIQKHIMPSAPGGKPVELRILLNQGLPKVQPPPTQN